MKNRTDFVVSVGARTRYRRVANSTGNLVISAIRRSSRYDMPGRVHRQDANGVRGDGRGRSRGSRFTAATQRRVWPATRRGIRRYIPPEIGLATGELPLSPNADRIGSSKILKRKRRSIRVEGGGVISPFFLDKPSCLTAKWSRQPSRQTSQRTITFVNNTSTLKPIWTAKSVA